MAKGGAKKAAAERAAANEMLPDIPQGRHQYENLETLETEIELVGSEVKSIRNGKANLRDGFCLIRNGQLLLHNVHISPHSHSGGFFNHDPLRTRILPAHHREIDKLRGLVDRKGLTLIPLNIHLKGPWIKLTISLNKGRKPHDKRAADREKRTRKEIKKVLKDI